MTVLSEVTLSCGSLGRKLVANRMRDKSLREQKNTAAEILPGKSATADAGAPTG